MIDDNLPKYYTALSRPDGKSIFHVWEAGQAHNNSITPAVACAHYRQHIVRQIVGHADKSRSILSLGCGNGFVEAQVAQDGYSVSAIDVHKDAIELCRRKGVDASLKDFYDLRPSCLKSVGCIYADGLIGHLYEEQDHLDRFFNHLESLVSDKSVYCVLSNDAPIDCSLTVQRHEIVPDFWYISAEFLVDLLLARGHRAISSQYYSYERPLSGKRRRTIVSFEICGQ